MSTPELFAQAEAGNQVAITVRVLALQIIQQLAALTDQLEQTATGMVILSVRLEMFSQRADTAGKQCNLHFRGTGVVLTLFVFAKQPGCFSSRNGHCFLLILNRAF